jgi:hypothetical protein
MLDTQTLEAILKSWERQREDREREREREGERE